jgi:hypothetical protein
MFARSASTASHVSTSPVTSQSASVPASGSTSVTVRAAGRTRQRRANSDGDPRELSA